MKKTISVLLSVMLVITLFTALPFTAGAAETGSASTGVEANGTTGDCTWELDKWGVLTISGTGVTGTYGINNQPWAEYADLIYSVEVTDGVTTLGNSLFANLHNLSDVDLADSVIDINEKAFYKCTSLKKITLSDGMIYIGSGAFVNTALSGIVIKNSDCRINSYAFGYTEGKNLQMIANAGFLVYGYSGSSAQTYAQSNGMTFIDLDAEMYDIYVSGGTAYNVVTGMTVDQAREGERIYAEPDMLGRFKVFTAFYSDDVVLDETDWSFTMPASFVGIYADYYLASPMDIDLSSGSAGITEYQYNYLVGLIQNGQLSGELNESSSSEHDEYTITFGDDSEVLLTYDRIYTYDYDYSPCYSEELFEEYEYNPVNFIFAENRIYEGNVDLTIPEAGSAWDYETMQAQIVPSDDDYSADSFTVRKAVWYNHYGISAFDTFEGGEEYFVGFELVPKEGYYFTLNSEVVINIPGDDRDIRLNPLYMNSDGSVHFSNGSDQIRIVGGEPHSILITDGIASLSSAFSTSVTQAVPGEMVYLSVDPDAIDDDMYVVMGSPVCSSDDTEIKTSEMVDVWYFYMPNHDVTGTFTYETDYQIDSVLPLYNGAYTVPGENSQRSERFGVSNVLRREAADSDYDFDEGITKYDLDGDGSWDVQNSGNEYSLLPTSSLTQNVTLTLSRSVSYKYPVRSVTVQVVEPVKYRITIQGGVASSQRGDFANEHVITEAYPGDTVYVLPRSADVDDDSYVVQFSQEATSSDVEIYDEAGISFIMPEKDVTVIYNYDCYTQDFSLFDFRYDDTVTLTDDGTGPRSEVYGVSMILWLKSASRTEVSDSVCRYDIDGDGSMDIEQNRDDNSYKLLSTNSLPDGGVTLTLSREESWTLPIRTLYIVLKSTETPMRGDVNSDGVVTIDDATIIQRHLAEYLTPDNLPLIDEDDPDWFYRADANNDGRISIKDVTAIQRHIAEIEELPA